jgi:predicted DNA-binding transcriptional regulator AlpA
MEALNPNTLLSPSQAAHYLECSLDTLKRWRRLNTGPKFVRLGSRKLVRYRVEDLDAFIDAQMGVAR